jgi:hypothetical protein
MPGGRPLGPFKRYTVEFVWPSEPGRYREAVVGVDEQTARRSVDALRGMHYALQVKISFSRGTTSRTFLRSCVVAQWDRLGNVTFRDTGEYSEFIPSWVTRYEKLPKEKADDYALVGS